MYAGNFIRSHWKSVLLSVIIVIVAASVLFYFFFGKGVKKELLISIYVKPNDSSETVLNYKEEITVKLPKGTIKSPDTLKIYKVENLEEPEFLDEIIKTYDFSLQKSNEFKKPIALEFSVQEIRNTKKDADIKNLCILYYDENAKRWRNEICEKDTKGQKLILKTSHFSSYGIGGGIKPSPIMYIWDVPYPGNINSAPDVNKAHSVLRSFGEQKTTKTTETISLAFDITQEILNIPISAAVYANKVKELPNYDKIEEIAGNIGIVFSLKEYAFKLYLGKYNEVKIDLFKELLKYSLIKWGGEAMEIAMVGVFLLDQALTSLGEKKNELLEEKYWNIYSKYNSEENSVIRKDKDWLDFVKNAIISGDSYNNVILDRIEKYLNDAWNDPVCNTLIPDNERENLMSKERQRIHKLISDNMEQIISEVYFARIDEAEMNLRKIAAEHNKETNIYVNVIGEPSEIKNLPVRVVVNKDQKLWEGKTGEAGMWSMRFTYYGYLYYNNPNTAELEYDGKKLVQTFKLENKGAYVTFTLPPKDKGKSKECDFQPGTYKGTIHQETGTKPYSGPLEIVITGKDNIRLTASYLTKYSTAYGEYTQDVKIECTGKIQTVENECLIFFEGKQNQKFITVSKHPSVKSGTNTQEGKWLTYAILNGNKLVRHLVKGDQFWEAERTK